MQSIRTVCLIKNFQNLNLKRSIKTTSILNAEPLRKKKKTDVAIVQLRVDRKRKKFQRLVEELEAQEKIKIPLFEYIIDKNILKNLDKRTRKNHERLAEIKNELERLNVVWSLYKGLENKMDSESLKKVIKTKLNTLKELDKLSSKLYENALLLDNELFPFKDDLIVKETVANKNYVPNDGQIIDLTKVWKIEI